MSEIILRKKCRISTNSEKDTFVGIKGEGGDILISFPLGFRLSKNKDDLKKDILLLMNVLAKNTDRIDSTLNTNSSYNEVNMPIQAFMQVISDYYARGYYKERETAYETAKRGKINWGRTVKQKKTHRNLEN